MTKLPYNIYCDDGTVIPYDIKYLDAYGNIIPEAIDEAKMNLKIQHVNLTNSIDIDEIVENHKTKKKYEFIKLDHYTDRHLSLWIRYNESSMECSIQKDNGKWSRTTLERLQENDWMTHPLEQVLQLLKPLEECIIVEVIEDREV